jgi:hypothetical protein
MAYKTTLEFTNMVVGTMTQKICFIAGRQLIIIFHGRNSNST